MNLKPFEKQQYLTIETFRKNGQGIKTPVWFAQDGEALYVWTGAGSGKVKRIHKNNNVRIAPATISGELLGEWLPAQAREDGSPEAMKHVKQIMFRKYGILFSIYAFVGSLQRGSKHTTLEVRLLEYGE